MAKISGKPPGGGSLEIDQINRFILEEIEELEIIGQPEPLTHIPNVDMYSTATDLVIEVELPGVKKEDINVSLHKRSITIRALKVECFEEDRVNYVCMERSFGRIFRALEIPCDIDPSRIKATFREGILTITIPRVEKKAASAMKVQIES